MLSCDEDRIQDMTLEQTHFGHVSPMELKPRMTVQKVARGFTPERRAKKEYTPQSGLVHLLTSTCIARLSIQNLTIAASTPK